MRYEDGPAGQGPGDPPDLPAAGPRPALPPRPGVQRRDRRRPKARRSCRWPKSTTRAAAKDPADHVVRRQVDRDVRRIPEDRCHLPGPGRAGLAALIGETAVKAFRVVGGWGYGRVDIRLDEDGEPRVLEVNCNPCLDSGVGLARSAEQAGITYPAAPAAASSRPRSKGRRTTCIFPFSTRRRTAHGLGPLGGPSQPVNRPV